MVTHNLELIDYGKNGLDLNLIPHWHFNRQGLLDVTKNCMAQKSDVGSRFSAKAHVTCECGSREEDLSINPLSNIHTQVETGSFVATLAACGTGRHWKRM